MYNIVEMEINRPTEEIFTAITILCSRIIIIYPKNNYCRGNISSSTTHTWVFDHGGVL